MSKQKEDQLQNQVEELLSKIQQSTDIDERVEYSSQLASLTKLHPDQVWEAAEKLHPETPPKEKETQINTVNNTINSRYGIDNSDILCPKTLEELMTAVREITDAGMHIRAVGSSRSLSDAPEPGDNTKMINTGGFADSVPVDATLLKEGSQASLLYNCGAGRTVKEIFEELDPDPTPSTPMARTLENLGAGHFQTIVGALSTSTHGSGITKPSFPQMVAGLQLVTLDGEGNVVARRIEPTNGITDPQKWALANPTIELIQNDDTFNAVLVSIGTMGVIYQVTLKLVPGFYLKEYRVLSWWSSVKESLQDDLKENDYYELVLDNYQSLNPTTNQQDYLVLVSKRNKIASYEKDKKRPLTMAIATTELGRIASAVLLEWELKNPVVRVPKSLKSAVKATQVNGYVDKNYKVLQLDMDVNADSAEQNVDFNKTVASIDAVLAYYKENLAAFSAIFPPDNQQKIPFKEDPDKLMNAWINHPLPTSPLGIRFVPANDAFMSPMHHRVTCTIESPMPGSDFLDHKIKNGGTTNAPMASLYHAYLVGRRKLFFEIEALLTTVGQARPHWGQANNLTAAQVRNVMPGFETWENQYKQYNTKGTFDGPFTYRLKISQSAEHSGIPQEKATGQVIFRINEVNNHGILKIKEDMAWEIYNGLTQPIRTQCKPLGPKKCKRMGVSLIASTQNLKDPVVCEMRFSGTGQLLSLTEDMKLYHSFKQNRHYGTCSFDGTRMIVSGEAATALIAYINAGLLVDGETGITGEVVVFRLLDMATGMWVIERD